MLPSDAPLSIVKIWGKSYGEEKNQSSHHGEKPSQVICTSLTFSLRPTSGSVWNRIRTYGAAKPHGRLTVCCLKPLGHPNIVQRYIKISEIPNFQRTFLWSRRESNSPRNLAKVPRLPWNMPPQMRLRNLIFYRAVTYLWNLLSLASYFNRYQI